MDTSGLTLLPDGTASTDSVVESWLRAHAGLQTTLPLVEDGRVDMGRLVDELPDRVHGEDSRVREEIKAHYMAIDPRRRKHGVYIAPEHLADVIIRGVELLEKMYDMVGISLCNGHDCPLKASCDYYRSGIAKDVTYDDGMQCMVERRLAKHHVEQWTTPPAPGMRPAVDPQRPEMLFYLGELIRLVVLEDRYARWLKIEQLKVRQNDKFRDSDGAESRDWLNDVEHPLVASYIRTGQQIQKVMQEMGLSPKLRLQMGLDDEALDLETRASRHKELAQGAIRDQLRFIESQMSPDDPEYAIMKRILEGASEKVVE